LTLKKDATDQSKKERKIFKLFRPGMQTMSHDVALTDWIQRRA
jgi:hypothetical protein